MNIETFFEKFELFADAPGAVGRMRELVLRLAFSGGFTGETPDNESLPAEWVTRSIASVCSSITPGFACSRSHQVSDGHVHLRTHNISTLGTLNFDLIVRVDPKMIDPKKASIRQGDILFNNTNSQELVGKTSLVDQDYDYAFSNHITRLRLKDGIYPGYVVYYLTLLRNIGYFAKICTRWINQAAVNSNTLKELTIPLPPLAEQRRIVAKVDELMALCDQLEAQQQDRETRHADLARAALARFADAPTPANLNYLFHPSYTISPADLRKTILSLAVQGKLVPQDPDDEPAKKALALCGVDLKRWSVTKNEERHDVPCSWVWIKFAGVGEQRLGKMLDAQKNRGESKPYLRNTNVQWMRFELNDVKRMRIEKREEEELQLRFGDLLICEGGEPGRCAIWRDEVPEMYFQKALHRIRPCEAILSEYLAMNLQVDSQNEVLAGYFTGATIKHLTGRSLSAYPIPLPPLAEQRRIVAKVDQLMALVDELEARLAASCTTAENLLAALVAELTGTSNGRKVASTPTNPATPAPRPKVQATQAASTIFIFREKFKK